MDAKSDVFTSSMHIISQHFVLLAVKEVLNPYKKRQDFEYLHALEKFE
jgi:hypothetical protein